MICRLRLNILRMLSGFKQVLAGRVRTWDCLAVVAGGLVKPVCLGGSSGLIWFFFFPFRPPMSVGPLFDFPVAGWGCLWQHGLILCSLRLLQNY